MPPGLTIDWRKKESVNDDEEIWLKGCGMEAAARSAEEIRYEDYSGQPGLSPIIKLLPKAPKYL